MCRKEWYYRRNYSQNENSEHFSTNFFIDQLKVSAICKELFEIGNYPIDRIVDTTAQLNEENKNQKKKICNKRAKHVGKVHRILVKCVFCCFQLC